jgi:1-deoxy-D-xylulose-5-phosphate reductoisomerase
MKRIAVLGATGSIGVSTQAVVRAHPERMQIVGMTSHSRWEDLAKACHEFRPLRAALSDPAMKSQVLAGAFPAETRLEFGPDAVAEIAAMPEADIALSGIVGAAGLRGTIAALEAGKPVALANKETLVVAGPLVMDLVRRNQTGSAPRLLPVDSEHNAVFQALECGRRQDLKRIILTASGGPFRTWPLEKLQGVTREDALAHPTWNMGPKITVDSATMMNKALEVIEARWLFDLKPAEIDVVIHPQSIVHSMVEFLDGSVIAQLSPPDMKLPIQYALTWPERWTGVSPRLDLTKSFDLHFEPPDLQKFPALSLGFEVAERGGTCGAVLNAANEAAVARFLKRELAFTDIARACREILNAHTYSRTPTLEELLQLDAWAREEMFRWK